MRNEKTQMLILAQSTMDKVIRLVEADKVAIKDIRSVASRLMDIQLQLAEEKLIELDNKRLLMLAQKEKERKLEEEKNLQSC